MKTEPKITSYPQKPYSKCFLTMILYCLLCSQGVHAADPAQSDQEQLTPGRYVLITQGDAAFDPVIVSITKRDNEFLISVENQKYVDPTVRIDSGSVIFQMTQKGKVWDQRSSGDMPKEYRISFAGVPSSTIVGAISGAFSSIYYYHKGGSPGAATGTFLLFPVDKK